MKLAIALVLLAACQGRKPESSSQDQPPVSAGSQTPADAVVAVDANLDACRAAAARVPALPRIQRTVALLNGCQPCGDWGPILGWSIPSSKGGPSRQAIEQGLLACHAFCEPNAKQRFFESLDAARESGTRRPWRLLGDICKAEVSAAPDGRYMGAAYFALDRVARMVGDPVLLAAIELPLPALTISGVGVELPSSPLIAPEAGPAALTINAKQLLLGSLTSAKLSATGVQIQGDYPGNVIEPKALAAALARPEVTGPVALLASQDIPASQIVEVVAAAGGHEIRLAVADLELLGWIIPGTVPIALTVPSARAPAGKGARFALDANAFEAAKAAKATPREQLTRAPVTIALDPSATVGGLANLLGALGYLEVKSVVLVNAPAKPAKPPARPAGKP